MKPLVSLVVVHWNTPDLLKKQLRLFANYNSFQIIVVDNNSESSLNWIEEEFPKIELVKNNFNRGFAFACNQGVLKSIGEWLLFLNPDVEITPSQINDMVEFSNKNKLDACSVKTTQSYQKPLPTWLPLLIEFTPVNRFIELKWFTTSTLFGGCLLIKTEVLITLGGWDERFFLWFEDSDLTKRVTDNGYKIGWSNIPIGHLGGASFKKLGNQFKRDVFFQSMQIFAKKHFNILGNLIVNLIKKKYTARNLLPEIFAGTSITIPNCKEENLKDFFLKNKTFLENNAGFEWIVISSGISDIWKWRREYPHIRFISINKNKGFASTVNIGFRISSGRWLATVNDDVILTRNWLEKCLFNISKNTGSINPIIYRNNKDIESAGIKILNYGKAIPLEKVPNYIIDDRRQSSQKLNLRSIDATNGACVIYSKEALNKVGLFDEKFGSYLEDIDLSLRLKKAEYKNIVSLSSKVVHEGQKTSKALGLRKPFYDFRNWIYVILKNWTLIELIVNSPSIFIERLKNLYGIFKAAKKH